MAGSGQVYSFKPQPLRLGLFDLGGVLYHANYYELFELAREDLLRSGGFPYTELAAGGAHLAVVEAQQKFLRSIRYGDELRIDVRIEQLRSSSLVFTYEIFNLQSGEPVHQAWTRMVYAVEREGALRPGRLPERLRTLLQPYCGES